MNIKEKISYLKSNHFCQWLNTRIAVANQISDDNDDNNSLKFKISNLDSALKIIFNFKNV